MTPGELRERAVRVWRYPPMLDDVWHTKTPLPNWLPSCIEGLWLPAPEADALLALAEAVEAYRDAREAVSAHTREPVPPASDGWVGFLVRHDELCADLDAKTDAMLAALAAVRGV